MSGGGGSRLSEMEKLGLPALTDYLEVIKCVRMRIHACM